jgi:hypothetical protein
VQRPTMKFVATKTADQLDLQALHRVERLVSQRTAIIAIALANKLARIAWSVLAHSRILGREASSRVSIRQ